eukprot:m.187247 g.187247  ORF g.187247 m.187247 type:complete len:783 (+) comp15603_c1_seq4:121-2469(+)
MNISFAFLSFVVWVCCVRGQSCSQSSDWLIHTPESKTTAITISAPSPYPAGSKILQLGNGLIERHFFMGTDFSFCTVEYRHMISGQTFFRALSPEANITVNGTDYDIGMCTGQPPTHSEFWSPEMYGADLKLSETSLLLKNITILSPTALFPWAPGRRNSSKLINWPPKGVHVVAFFAPPEPSNISQMLVAVHYEMYDGIPALRKWVTVHHTGVPSQPPVVINRLSYELLRAPNFAPGHMSIILQQANNPVPFDEQVVPEQGQSFPGRTNQLWFQDPNYDQQGDQEIHVTYTYYTFLVVNYGYSVTYQGSTGPGAIVSSESPMFQSLSVRTVLHDSSDVERKGLAVREVHRYLAPQLLENPINFMITDISSSAKMRLAVDQAAETGQEIVIIGYGAAGWCGMCFKQLNDATFKAWFKQEVMYANSKGIEVSGYTLMQHNGWGEVVPEAEQTLSRTGSRGPTACFATDWHAGYREAVLNFIQETGMTGLETDGQYESIPCADTGGDHHHNGIEGGWSYGLKATLDFNMKLKGLGVYQTGADGYCFSGANKWNHADTDAFGHLPIWESMTVGRMYIYDSTINRLQSSGAIGVNDLSGSTKTCAANTVIGRTGCFDFILGTQYLMGSIPSFRANALYNPLDPDASKLANIILKWATFYKKYRGPRPSGDSGLLTAKLIHVQRPDSRHMEAVAHVTADSSSRDRGMVAVFNSDLTRTLQQNLTVPLYYTGLAPGTALSVRQLNVSTATFTEKSIMNVTLGVNAGFTDIVLSVTLSPASYTAFLLSL